MRDSLINIPIQSDNEQLLTGKFANQIVGLCQDMMYLNLTAAYMVNNYATIKDATSAFIETITPNIEYTIQRLGLIEPANFTVSINPVSSNIISAGSNNVHSNLSYGQEINDGIVTLNVIKSRAGSQGVLKMSIEFLNTIKTMENYRVERPVDLDDVDFEPCSIVCSNEESVGDRL